MFKWIKAYSEATSQTRYFFLTLVVYGIALLATTAYVYGRLDFVRSYKTTPTAQHPQN